MMLPREEKVGLVHIVVQIILMPIIHPASVSLQVMRHAGVAEASLFTGHSFRRGGASWAFRSGVPGELIQICGDWASDSYKRYLEFSTQNKLDLAALLTRHLPR